MTLPLGLRQRSASDLVMPATAILCVLCLVTLQRNPIEQIAQAGLAAASVFVLIAARKDLRHFASGPSSRLLFAALGSYMAIGGFVALIDPITDPDFQIDWTYEFLRQGYHLLIFAALVAGLRTVLRDHALQRLSMAWLGILTAACSLVVISPLAVRFGLLDPYGRTQRATGLFEDPNDAALLAVLTVSVGLALRTRAECRRLVRVSFVLGLLALFLALSITATAVLILLMLVHLFLDPVRARTATSGIRYGAVLTILILYLAWLLALFEINVFTSPESDIDELSAGFTLLACESPRGTVEIAVYGMEFLSDDHETAQDPADLTLPTAASLRNAPYTAGEQVLGRFDLWREGVRIAGDNAAFGTGFHALRLGPNSLGVHNMYVLLVGEAGLLPLVIYLAFLILVARRILRARPSPARDIAGCGLVLVVLYGIVFHHVAYNSLFLLILAATAALCDDRLGSSRPTRQDDRGETATQGSQRDGTADESVPSGVV